MAEAKKKVARKKTTGKKDEGIFKNGMADTQAYGYKYAGFTGTSEQKKKADAIIKRLVETDKRKK